MQREYIQSQIKEYYQKLEESHWASMIGLGQSSLFFMMMWTMLWGFFSVPGPYLGHLILTITLAFLLQACHTLYNNMNSQSKTEEEKEIPTSYILLPLTALAFINAYALGSGALIATLFWALFIIGYPYLARMTWWPQVYYGIAFGAWPVLIGQCAGLGVNFNVIPLMVAGFLWATAFETLRAGTELDKQNKLHFIKEILGPQKTSFVGICLILAFLFFVITGIASHMSGVYYGFLMIAQAIITHTFNTYYNEEEAKVSCSTYSRSGFAALAIIIGLLFG